MAEFKPCINSNLDNLSSAQILERHGDKFTANALWCDRAACTFLKAYLATGVVVNRGTCVEQKQEFSDEFVYPNTDPTTDGQEPANQLELPVATDDDSDYAQEREIAARSTSFGPEDLRDEMIGVKGMRTLGGTRWMGWR